MDIVKAEVINGFIQVHVEMRRLCLRDASFVPESNIVDFLDQVWTNDIKGFGLISGTTIVAEEEKFRALMMYIVASPRVDTVQFSIPNITP